MRIFFDLLSYGHCLSALKLLSLKQFMMCRGRGKKKKNLPLVSRLQNAVSIYSGDIWSQERAAKVEQKTQQKHALAIRVFVQLEIVSNIKHKHNLSTKHGFIRLCTHYVLTNWFIRWKCNSHLICVLRQRIILIALCISWKIIPYHPFTFSHFQFQVAGRWENRLLETANSMLL